MEGTARLSWASLMCFCLLQFTLLLVCCKTMKPATQLDMSSLRFCSGPQTENYGSGMACTLIPAGQTDGRKT